MLRTKQTIILLLLWVGYTSLFAQQYGDPLKKSTHRRQQWAKSKVTTLANRLCSGLADDYTKSVAIYRWVAAHIRYDKQALRKSRLPNPESWNTLRRRKAVCIGYAILFQELCKAADLNAEVVSGSVKGFFNYEGYRYQRAEHAWNAVKVGGNWLLVDPTWGSLSAVLRKQALRRLAFQLFRIPYQPRYRIRHKPNMKYFAVDPDELGYSHNPIDPAWQLRDPAQPLWSFEDTVGNEPQLVLDNPFPSVIASMQGKTYAEKEIVQGSNGLIYNPRDYLDLAQGEALRGRELMYKLPELGDDTASWNQALRHFRKSMEYMGPWYRSNGNEHHRRLRELAFIKQSMKTHCMRIRGDYKFVQADRRKIRREEAVTRRQASFEIAAYRRAKERLQRRPPSRPTRPPDNPQVLTQPPIAALQRADSIGLLTDSLHAIFLEGRSEARRQARILIRTRNNAIRRFSSNHFWLMQSLELHYLGGVEEIDSLTRLLLPQRKARVIAHTQNVQQYRMSRARSLAAARQFEVAGSLVYKARALGADNERCDKLADSISSLIDTMAAHRTRQLTEVMDAGRWMRYKLDSTNWVMRSTVNQIATLNYGLNRYIGCARKMAHRRYYTDRMAAKRTTALARSGIRTLQLWIGEAKLRSKGKEVPVRYYLPRKMRKAS